MRFSQKIVKIVATRFQILRLKCSKFDFGWSSAPDLAGGACSALQTTCPSSKALPYSALWVLIFRPTPGYNDLPGSMGARINTVPTYRVPAVSYQ